MWKTVLRLLTKLVLAILALALLILPLVSRRLYFYKGEYEPGEVSRPDLRAIEASAPEMEPFVDRYTSLAPGTILVDGAHSNRFDMAELSVLQARLAARGQRLEVVEEVDGLLQRLRYAQALVVISPGENWTPDELQRVEDFVEKGGRLLLVADPTRFEIDWDFLVLDSDVPHINDLAARFGLLFQRGYLYNTVENEGNFRNIKLSEFGSHELTEGLRQVVFYAAGSIVSEAQALIVAGGETRSSGSERTDALAVAVLAADEAVLALGDLTFLTEPYNGVYDNDRFVANIADFLTGGQRKYDLADFPLFFGNQVSLVYTGDPLLDSDLLSGSSDLQALFESVDKELQVLEEEDEALDTLFLGLYQENEEVESYLEAAQVTILITPTEQISSVDSVVGDEAAESEAKPSPKPEISPTLVPTEPLTITAAITVTPELTTTPEATTTIMASNGEEISVTLEVSPSLQNRVEIESFGEMVLTGTAMLVLQTDGERQVLVVLADTETGLESATQRLTEGDLEGCLVRETATPTSTAVVLCPTGEVGRGEGTGGWQEPELEPVPPAPSPSAPITDTIEPVTDTNEVLTDTVEPQEPVSEPGGSVVVVSMDKGEGRYDSMTGADAFASVLAPRYTVTVWSVASDGAPDGIALLDYDVVIWAFGDFDLEEALGEDEADALITVMFSGVPFIMSGAFVGGTELEAVQRDLQVSDVEHPLTGGFQAGEVIAFITPPSGSEYETSVFEDLAEGEGTAVLLRGPASDSPGAPSVVVQVDEFTEARIGWIGFPFYLLPQEAQGRLALNMVEWMLSP